MGEAGIPRGDVDSRRLNGWWRWALRLRTCKSWLVVLGVQCPPAPRGDLRGAVKAPTHILRETGTGGEVFSPKDPRVDGAELQVGDARFDVGRKLRGQLDVAVERDADGRQRRSIDEDDLEAVAGRGEAFVG
jgi:hypothetical protein